MKQLPLILALFIASSLAVSAAEKSEQPARTTKAGYKKSAKLSGPGSTTAQLEEDDEIKETVLRFPAIDNAMASWFDTKALLNDKYGLQLGFAYTMSHLTASGVADGAEDSAGSGLFRIYGSWTGINKDGPNSGKLVFSMDHRNRHMDVAPSDFGFQAGYLGIPSTLFSDVENVLVDLNWQQKVNDGKGAIVLGRFDPNDFFDVLGYANPWTSFSNLSILFNASIALPDASTGIGAGSWINDQYYVQAAVNDVNSTVTDIKLFTETDELYKTVEFGWSPSREQRYFNNVHVTAWHADERDDDGIEESEGFTFSANYTKDMTWMTFLKAGFSDGTAPLYNESVTVGGIYYLKSRSDLVGFGVNWGDPSDSSLDPQITSELFWRIQLAQNLAITPSVQCIVDPALNPDEDNMIIGSIRTRFTF